MASWWSRIRPSPADARSFDAMVLPHLGSGYNLARWLLRDDASAQDAVQEAAMRAFRYFGSLRGGEARPWFLGIVRNTCLNHLGRGSTTTEMTGLDDGEIEALQVSAGQLSPDPEQTMDHAQERLRVNAALRALPPPLREVIVLRELEGLDYAQIAKVVGIPIGTVMSRLARSRMRLRVLLARQGLHQ